MIIYICLYVHDYVYTHLDIHAMIYLHIRALHTGADEWHALINPLWNWPPRLPKDVRIFRMTCEFLDDSKKLCSLVHYWNSISHHLLIQYVDIACFPMLCAEIGGCHMPNAGDSYDSRSDSAGSRKGVSKKIAAQNLGLKNQGSTDIEISWNI